MESTTHILDTDAAAGMFAALGAPVRLTLLRALVRAGQPGMTVGALQKRLAMPGSTLSHHLRALMLAGVVAQRRDGRRLICTACFDRLDALGAFLVTECCADITDDTSLPLAVGDRDD